MNTSFKLVFTSLLLLSPALAMAEAEFTENSLGKGGYYGLDLGYNRTNINFHHRIFSSSGTTFDKSISSNNPLGGIYAGIGEISGNVYIGAEAGLQLSSNSGDLNRMHDGHDYIDKFHYQNFITADIMPGYFFSDNYLLYGRFGYAFGRLDTKQIKDGAIHFTHGTQLNGGRIGVGLAMPYSKSVSVGFDYIHTAYGSDSFNGPNTNQENYGVRPSADTVSLHAQWSMN